MALDKSKYAAEEMDLYDQLRRTKDEDDLLVIMSDLQGHFLEGLKKQHEIKKQEWVAQQAGKSKSSSMLYSKKKQHYRSKLSQDITSDKSNNSTPNLNGSNNHNSNNSSNSSNGSAVPPNARRAQTLDAVKLDTIPGSKVIQNSARQLPTSKFNAAMAVSQMPLSHKYKFSSTDVMKDIDKNEPLMTPRTKTGQYRMSLFCDIKFVKSIFVRWISCDNEVLCHVAARTLAILFSHEYLTLDQMSDLAELLLGVHETKTPFATVPVTYRASRPGALLYGLQDTDSSGSDEGSDSAILSSDEDFNSPTPGPQYTNENGNENNTNNTNNNNNNNNIDTTNNSDPNSPNSPNTPLDVSTPLNNTNNSNNSNNNSPKKDNHSPSASTSLDHAKFQEKLRQSGLATAPGSSPDKNDNNVSFENTTNNSNNSNNSSKNKNKQQQRKRKRTSDGEMSETGPISESDSEGDRTIERVPFDIHWNNRLYSAMRVLSTIVGNEEVKDECVLALDEWFSTEDVVLAMFERSSKAGFGVLEAFLQLIKEILIRFCMNPNTMGQSKMADVICRNKGGYSRFFTAGSSDANGSNTDVTNNSLNSSHLNGITKDGHNSQRVTPNYSHKQDKTPSDNQTNILLEIIIRRTSTLVTRATALELCPLLMISASDPEPFALQCLNVVLDDGRFNPFEPGDIHMSRTFKRGEHGKMRTVNPENPLDRGYTVADYIPSLLFQSHNDVFIDQETVMRLTFLTVIKCMNTLAQKIDQAELEAEQKMLRAKSKKNASSPTDQSTRSNGSDGSPNKLGGGMSPPADGIASPSPSTPKMNFDDPDDQVEHLEGEFDLKTARKIRNFFSRDADYTRERILELVSDEDDVLIDVLLELLLIETRLRKSKSRLAKRIRYLFDPFMLFHDFLELTQADHTFLLDFLISNETAFLDYLLRFAKRMSNNWHPTPASQDQVEHVMSICIRLRMTIANLHQKKLFPYSPKALIKAMEKMEFCYESANVAMLVESNEWSSVANTNAMANSDYIGTVELKQMASAQHGSKKSKKNKKTKTKKQVSKRGSNIFDKNLSPNAPDMQDMDEKDDSPNRESKPKKLVINSLFLQDVKYAKQKKEKEQEIIRKRHEIQKRKKKKHGRNRSKSKHHKNDSTMSNGDNDINMADQNGTKANHDVKRPQRKLKIKTKRNKIKGNFEHLNINFQKGLNNNNNNNAESKENDN